VGAIKRLVPGSEGDAMSARPREGKCSAAHLSGTFGLSAATSRHRLGCHIQMAVVLSRPADLSALMPIRVR